MKIIHEFLFWLHLTLLALALLAGLFLPLPVILLLAFLHRLQMLTFDGCLLSQLQVRLGGLPKQGNFIQFALQRFFNLTTTPLQGKLLDYGLVSVSLTIALISHR